MKDEELKHLWKAGNQNVYITDTQKLGNELNEHLLRLNRDIKQRDRREILLATILIPIFALVAYFIPPVLSKTGAALLVPALLLIIRTLRASRQPEANDNTLTMSAYMTAQHSYLIKQEKLLKNALWWYILPITAPLCLFFAGVKNSAGIYATAALGILLYIMNTYAALKQLKPLRKQIEQTIAESQTDVEE